MYQSDAAGNAQVSGHRKSFTEGLDARAADINP